MRHLDRQPSHHERRSCPRTRVREGRRQDHHLPVRPGNRRTPRNETGSSMNTTLDIDVLRLAADHLDSFGHTSGWGIYGPGTSKRRVLTVRFSRCAVSIPATSICGARSSRHAASPSSRTMRIRRGGRRTGSASMGLLLSGRWSQRSGLSGNRSVIWCAVLPH